MCKFFVFVDILVYLLINIYFVKQENIANLITVMCEITVDPGKFDTLCGALVDSFIYTLNDVNYTRPLVEAIVNQVSLMSENMSITLTLF